MSARRAARAHAREDRRPSTAEGPSLTDEGVPQALAIGRCVEVWAPEGTGAPYAPHITAHGRWSRVAHSWRAASGLEDRDAWRLLPAGGAPWSTATDPDQAAERLARAGCTLADLPRLRTEADLLLLTHSKENPNDVRR